MTEGNGRAPRPHYPAYRPSGVEWLGEIPAHWEVRPLKRVANYVNRGLSPDYVDGAGIPVISQACIQWDGLRLENVKWQRATDVSSVRGMVCAGDLLVNSTGTGTLGRVAVFNEAGCHIADGHVTIVRFIQSSIDSKYAYYLIQTGLYQGYIYAALVFGSTNQIELGREGLRSAPFLLPLLAEQLAIAAFLDRETARLDVLLAAKQRLLDLLAEKRAALITRAVTRGLDPTVPLKESGVSWLGEIPAHWEVAALKRGYQVCLGKMLQPAPSSPSDSLQPYLRAANLAWNGVDISDIKEMWFSADERMQLALRPGDLLVSEGGDVGRSAIWQGELPVCYIQNAINRVRSRGADSTRFLYYWLFTMKDRGLIDAICSRATIAHFTAEKVEVLPVVLPPPEEQRAIADYLNWQTARLDALAGRVRRAMDLLREYRAALITAAVTGQIDVRGGGA